MWTCEPKHLKPLMSEGERFPHLIDRLIRATGAKFGIRQSDIQTQLRTNITDGGVDTAVDVAIEGCNTGWFEVPTCWQYKAQAAVSIDDAKINEESEDQKDKKKRGRPRTKTQNELQEEVNKPHVKQLIESGYGYRLCILGDLTDEKVKDWEEQLFNEVKKINPDAPAPRVVHGGFLPNWIERYPAIFPWLVGTEEHAAVFHLESWGRNITRDLPNYVPNSEWQGPSKIIERHCDFSTKAHEPCLRIGGPAGVGKSRLVYEVLNKHEAAAGLVVYAADEQEAKKISASLANDDYRAWLVADECSEATLNYLNQNLKGLVDRVRVICINNVKPIHDGGQIWLQPAEDVTDVLLSNYEGQVPPESCRKYAQISKGFLRFASDMCEHHDQIEQGDYGNIMANIETYIRQRFGDWLDVASLIALFRIVGFENDVVNELNAISAASGIDTKRFHQMVHELKDSPGFVVKQGRYRYITPEIVARTIFQEGWNRYVAHDLTGFVGNLPESMVQPFLDRAAELGGEEVRAQVAETFQLWAADITVEQLRNPKLCAVFRALIETKVEDYLPLLRAILSRASDEELKSIGEDYYGNQSSRRILVWMLESLVAFPDYFDDCEECLFALARGENEQQIGNNATNIWSDLFSIMLSGSAAPFETRFQKLKVRLEKEEHIELCLLGLSRAFLGPTTKIVGPPSLAGRIRPKSWRPSTNREYRECLTLALSALSHLMDSDNEGTRRLTFELIERIDHHLIEIGMFEDFKSSIDINQLNEVQRRRLMHSYEEYLSYAKEAHSGEREEYFEKVRQAVVELKPTDFVGQFRTVISRDPWDDRHKETDELSQLVKDIAEDPNLLYEQLEWLNTEEAKSVEPLGFELAKVDSDGSIGLMIADNSMDAEISGFLRGYIRGVAKQPGEFDPEFTEKIDQIQEQNPIIAADSIRYGGDGLDALNRTIDMVSSYVVPAHFLTSFAYGYGEREITETEIIKVLTAIIAREKATNDGSISAGIKFISSLLYANERHENQFLKSDDAKELSWTTAELGSLDPKRRDAYELDKIVDWLRRFDQARAFKLFSSWIISENFDLNKKGAERLSQSAAEFPELTMQAFGEALLNEEIGYRLQISVVKEVVANLPSDSVTDWVQSHGEAAAKAIARHLPVPYRNEDVTIIVPEVTINVLEMFRSDEVMGAFAASTLHGTWWGNAAERFRSEAEVAKQLMTHESEAIREWAKSEFRFKMELAEREDREHEERDLPS